MDIAFHYFAVKTLALYAGMKEDQAQLIACYSQLVDDFNLYLPIPLDYVPPYAEYLACRIHDGFWLFDPATTGFDTAIDKVNLITPENRQWIVTPFHFIPPKCVPKHTPNPDRAGLRTVPASMTDKSLVTGMMDRAIKSYIASSGGHDDAMRVGMLLHIFADTYAHQGFSGFLGWENHATLTKALNNIAPGRPDITPSYWPDVCSVAPSIGHANLNIAPDDSHIFFQMKYWKNQGDSDYSGSYERNNLDEFVKAAREIVGILRRCENPKGIDGASTPWDEFVKNLIGGLRIKRNGKSFATLRDHWRNYFPHYDYKYDPARFRGSECFQPASVAGTQRALSAAEFHRLYIEDQPGLAPEILTVVDQRKSEDFFRFNVIADEIRVEVNSNTKYREGCKHLVDNYRSKHGDLP